MRMGIDQCIQFIGLRKCLETWSPICLGFALQIIFFVMFFWYKEHCGFKYYTNSMFLKLNYCSSLKNYLDELVGDPSN